MTDNRRILFAEQWEPIEGFPGYAVSCCGKVRGPRSILKGERYPYGHIGVQLYRDGHRFKRWVHRLVLEAFTGPCPDGFEAAHNDGNPSNNSIDNLRWTTHADNQDDRQIHGTVPQGITHGRSKLTEDDVRYIRKSRQMHGTYASDLAAEFGVTKSTVEKIFRRETWTHI